MLLRGNRAQQGIGLSTVFVARPGCASGLGLLCFAGWQRCGLLVARVGIVGRQGLGPAYLHFVCRAGGQGFCGEITSVKSLRGTRWCFVAQVTRLLARVE